MKLQLQFPSATADSDPVSVIVNRRVLLAGMLLSAFGLFGLSLSSDGELIDYYLMISLFLPMLVFPAAACVVALAVGTPRDWRSQAKGLWSRYVGLAICAADVGGRHFSGFASDRSYAMYFLLRIGLMHLVAFGGMGLVLFLMPRTRPPESRYGSGTW